MNETADLIALKARHEALEQEIEVEANRPLPDQAHLTELKREKLKIKEDMALMVGELEVA
ncbi:MAG: hypothetical protein CMM46_16265 [Rhodospirillaceae bacterium]|nr:hypothetical protein [Rhodospirillaceae bacterium]|tara:strand:+ start:1438 stop:1617 length:180 start_codon:yes stop_codon:yes gene_type:complete